MTGRRRAFLIPGMGQTTDIDAYRQIGRVFRRHGIEPIGVPMDWQRPGLEDLIADAAGFIGSHGDRPDVVLGFSLGAVCGLHAASSLGAGAAILCSLSPFFDEDRVRSPWWINLYGTWRIYRGASKPSYPRMQAGTRLVFIVGGREDRIISPGLRRMRQERFGGEHLVAAGAPHDIRHPDYLAAITGVIERL